VNLKTTAVHGSCFDQGTLGGYRCGVSRTACRWCCSRGSDLGANVWYWSVRGPGSVPIRCCWMWRTPTREQSSLTGDVTTAAGCGIGEL